jgi:hypothetical protein
MSILGLNSERTKDDNLFQRLFWPSNHPGEVDVLGKQGFWICLVVGVMSGVTLAIMGHVVIGLETFAFFALGGVGVREHSVFAAVLVAFGYLVNMLITTYIQQMPGVMAILVTGLLLANIRGTYIAAAWKKRGNVEDFPERYNTTFFDRLSDQMPARIWPVGRFVFYGVSAVYMGLLVVATINLSHRAAQLRAEPTDTELQVTPSSR